MIKGFEIRKIALVYDIEVWDKNRLTLFTPPLTSETVKKLDRTKVATFLEEYLSRGYHQ